MQFTLTLITRVVGMLSVALSRNICGAVLTDTRQIVFNPSKTLLLLIIVLFAINVKEGFSFPRITVAGFGSGT